MILYGKKYIDWYTPDLLCCLYVLTYRNCGIGTDVKAVYKRIEMINLKTFNIYKISVQHTSNSKSG